MLAFCPSPHVRTRPPVSPSAVRASPDGATPFRSRRARRTQPQRRHIPADGLKDHLMPEVIFTGPAGRLEGRYHPAKQKNAPIAMVLHPHPQFRGTMNHPDRLSGATTPSRIAAFRCCASISAASAAARARSTTAPANCRMPPPRSTGRRPSIPEARACWVAGFSFGAWIGMQLLMRRPEVEGFISIAPPRQPLRLLLPCALPVLGPDRAWREGRRRAAQGRQHAGREAEDAEGHRHRPADHPRRQPFLRRTSSSR